MKDGYDVSKIVAKEGWDWRLIPTEPNKLSDYLKGISL